MRFRRARPDDASTLTALAIRSKRSWGYSDEFMEKVMPDMIVHRKFLEEEHGIVAEEKGVPLGYAIVRIEGDTAFLRDLFVEPAEFRKGLGTALFDRALRVARKAGASGMRLFGDPNAIGFYQRLGMRQIGEEPSIIGSGRRLPVMMIEIVHDRHPQI